MSSISISKDSHDDKQGGQISHRSAANTTGKPGNNRLYLIESHEIYQGEKMTRRNLPNKLTIFRIISVPFVIFLLLIDRNIPALALFLFSSLTDFVDGYLARKSDQISPFGKFADPIADKLLVAGVLITFIQLGELTAIPVVIIIARGFLVTGVRLLGSRTGKVISASWLGKIKTISHMSLIIAIMLNAELDFAWLNMAIPSLVYFAVATAVVSGVDYLYRNRKLIKESFSG